MEEPDFRNSPNFHDFWAVTTAQCTDDDLNSRTILWISLDKDPQARSNFREIRGVTKIVSTKFGELRKFLSTKFGELRKTIRGVTKKFKGKFGELRKTIRGVTKIPASNFHARLALSAFFGFGNSTVTNYIKSTLTTCGAQKNHDTAQVLFL